MSYEDVQKIMPSGSFSGVCRVYYNRYIESYMKTMYYVIIPLKTSRIYTIGYDLY